MKDVLMPSKFNVLARYNGEKAHGLVHTEHWVEQMTQLQAEFNEWAESVRPPGMRAITRLGGWGNGDWRAEKPRE